MKIEPVKFDCITIEWIEEQRDKLDLRYVDLCNLIGIHKSSLSKIIHGERKLTKFQKAAFYYCIKCVYQRRIIELKNV